MELDGLELRSLMQNGESSEGGRSQRNEFFVTLKRSEHLKENKSIKASDRSRTMTEKQKTSWSEEERR